MNQMVFIMLLIGICHSPASCQVKVQMTKEHGVYTVPCKVNGLPLKFIFDTGASDISMSLTEAQFMLKNGMLSKQDIIGSSYSQIANGDIITNTKINLQVLEIGNIKIYDVRASIIHELEAPLLLGQSALEQLGGYQIVGNTLTILGRKSNGINTISYSSNKVSSLSKKISYRVEKQAEFPGGSIKMYQFLQENINYPSEAQKANVSGELYVSFVVDKDGSIQEIQILKGLGFGTEEEAIRILRAMPRWRPGKVAGRAVKVLYNLPISFTLE